MHNLALTSKSWVFREALSLLKQTQQKIISGKTIIFATGYGPSGLPHIGTFGEVVRTNMVRRAFESIAPGTKTKLIVVSDDMDGLRKIPENLPNQDMLKKHLGKPLVAIPDPFGTHSSYGKHMNDVLKSFLDKFEFEYELVSSAEFYRSGRYNQHLQKLLENYDEVMGIMLPTLRDERRKTYSPFLPICQKSGAVLQVAVVEQDSRNSTITYRDNEGELVETMVTDGSCKLQWRPDWGMRWAALEVDYEMYGKDLIPSAEISAEVCKIVGGEVPKLMHYELFLDENGHKISKSKGNGLSIEQWLRYASVETLALYMYHTPSKAKRLYFDVIPKTFDEYLSFINKYHQQAEEEKIDNPVRHVHAGKVPRFSTTEISFSLLLNLASACNPKNKSVLWGFVGNYIKQDNVSESILDQMIDFACCYYEDFVKPKKKYRLPDEREQGALEKLLLALQKIDKTASAEEIQNLVYDIGKNSDCGFENLRDWFKALYQILLGQEQGPRMGSFIKLYGIENSINLIKDALQDKIL
jgi:lysyl-tRNA synthetase class 1